MKIKNIFGRFKREIPREIHREEKERDSQIWDTSLAGVEQFTSTEALYAAITRNQRTGKEYALCMQTRGQYVPIPEYRKHTENPYKMAEVAIDTATQGIVYLVNEPRMFDLSTNYSIDIPLDDPSTLTMCRRALEDMLEVLHLRRSELASGEESLHSHASDQLGSHWQRMRDSKRTDVPLLVERIIGLVYRAGFAATPLLQNRAFLGIPAQGDIPFFLSDLKTLGAMEDAAEKLVGYIVDDISLPRLAQAFTSPDNLQSTLHTEQGTDNLVLATQSGSGWTFFDPQSDTSYQNPDTVVQAAFEEAQRAAGEAGATVYALRTPQTLDLSASRASLKRNIKQSGRLEYVLHNGQIFDLSKNYQIDIPAHDEVILKRSSEVVQNLGKALARFKGAVETGDGKTIKDSVGSLYSDWLRFQNSPEDPSFLQQAQLMAAVYRAGFVQDTEAQEKFFLGMPTLEALSHCLNDKEGLEAMQKTTQEIVRYIKNVEEQNTEAQKGENKTWPAGYGGSVELPGKSQITFSPRK
jgi:hypothetical protein